MAKVPLAPIGRPRDAFLDSASYERNRAALETKETELAARRAKVAQGWGPEYVERVHAKSKLTSRERIEKLKDPGTPIREIGRASCRERVFVGV